LSFTPTGPPPQPDTTSQDADKQKAEQAEREAAEKQRREDEARQRVLEAQRARQAQEAERRKQAEAEAAQQRQRQQEQADRERRLREEQEQQIRQARQQEEEARAARIREKDSALHALTEDIMFDSDQGLLLQFIENAAMNISQEVAKEVEMEKRVAYAEKKYERYLVDLKRSALAKIFVAVEKRKKVQRARERRKRLKEQRARLANQEEEELAKAPAPVRPPTETVNASAHPSVNSTLQRSAPTPSARRAKRTEERRKAQVPEQNGEKEVDSRSRIPDTKTASKNAKAPLSASMSNGNASVAAYSQSYQQAAANAPIDRTETDWFRLRAMGIDPSKQRKRSFDFASSDEEEQPKVEPKRPKLSPPALESQECSPPVTVEQEQRARFEAIKQGFRRSATSPSQSLNGAASINGRSSFNKSSNSVIEKARRMVAESRAAMPPPQHYNSAASLYRRDSIDGHGSSVIAKAREFIGQSDRNSPVQHDWSRSVPNLDFAASFSRPSTFGSSLRTTSANDRPAYWQRVSRFVPRHLYGKGADAARAYREEQNTGQSPASTRPASPEPLALSSPIPTQKSYIPPIQGQQFQGYTQQDQHSEEAESSGVEVVDVEAIDDASEEEDVDEQQYNDRDGPNPYPGRQYSQQHYDDEEQQYDEDGDSDMVDGDDDDEHGYTPGQYHEQASDEEIEESYEGDTEVESETASPPPQPIQRWFTQPQQQPVVNGFGGKNPGATEDDAIELSD
jgi:hypothetical protein